MWIEKTNGRVEQKLRLRGITLDYNTYQKLAAYDQTAQSSQIAEEELVSHAYGGFKKRVLQFAKFHDDGDEGNNSDEDEAEEDFLFEYDQLRPQRLGGVNTKKVTKIYRPIVPKGVVSKDFNVRHFGYKRKHSN